MPRQATSVQMLVGKSINTLLTSPNRKAVVVTDVLVWGLVLFVACPTF